MEKKLAVIVDNNEKITTGADNTEMCSCGADVAVEMCSREGDDTCGDGSSSVASLGFWVATARREKISSCPVASLGRLLHGEEK